MVTASTPPVTALLTAIFKIVLQSQDPALFYARQISIVTYISQHMAIIQFHHDIPPRNSVTRDT